MRLICFQRKRETTQKSRQSNLFYRNRRNSFSVRKMEELITIHDVIVYDELPTEESENASSLEAAFDDDDDDDDTSGEFFFALYCVTVPLLFGLFTCSGVVGNSLVIHLILFRKRMRTVTNLLLLNLAFADLSFVLVIPPFTAYQFAAERWPFGNVVCKLLHYLVNVTAYVTVYTLVLVAVIRYMTVVHSAATARFRTPRITVALIACIWVVMGTVNVPILVIYGAVLKTPWRGGSPGGAAEDCDLYDQESGRGLFASFFVFAYVFPLAVIGVFSLQILKDLTRHRPVAPGLRRSKSIRRKKQIGRLLVVVVVAFAVLWLPVHVHLLVAFFGRIPKHKAYHAASTLWHCLAYFNSCINPVIYNHTSKEFRDAFGHVVASLRRTICLLAPSPSSSSSPPVKEGTQRTDGGGDGWWEKRRGLRGGEGRTDVFYRMRRTGNVVRKFKFDEEEEGGGGGGGHDDLPEIEEQEEGRV